MMNFPDVPALIAGRRPEMPVLCLCPERARAAARRFVAGFPGAVHYAVKANPHPALIGWLIEAGVAGFDVASIREIETVRGVDPEAHCAFNHPAKTRADIEAAYRHWGIRHFVIDHERELDKMIACAGRDCVIQVRIRNANPDAVVDLNDKFGADGQAAAAIMRKTADAGFTVAAALHVGWQALDARAYGEAMNLAAGAAGAAGVELAYINLGGGFPSVMMPARLRIEDYFAAIARAKSANPALADVALNCEPGSALAFEAAATLCRVVLVKDDAVYLTDGIYGLMNELKHSRLVPPLALFAPDGQPKAGAPRAFTVFGPTCDSLDVMPVTFPLPQTVAEGDYLCFGRMGAYSNALATGFNGLGAWQATTVDELPL